MFSGNVQLFISDYSKYAREHRGHYSPEHLGVQSHRDLQSDIRGKQLVDFTNTSIKSVVMFLRAYKHVEDIPGPLVSSGHRQLSERAYSAL